MSSNVKLEFSRVTVSSVVPCRTLAQEIPFEKKQPQIALRVTQTELERLNLVVLRVRKRNQHMDRTKVLRELIGFDSPMFVTDEDRRILKGGEPDDKPDTGELTKAVGTT